MGKGGAPYKQWEGLAIEPQHYPDGVCEDKYGIGKCIILDEDNPEYKHRMQFDFKLKE